MSTISRRTAVASAVAVAVSALVTACTGRPYPEIPRFAKSGGQTKKTLDATLDAIPGLTVLHASGGTPNVKGNVGYFFQFELQDGWRIADPPALVTFVVESAWSIRDAYQPNTSVMISLIAGPDSDVDLVAAAESSDWVPVGSQPRRRTDPPPAGVKPSGNTGVTVWLDLRTDQETTKGYANRERLGRWPGVAPSVPDGVTAPA